MKKRASSGKNARLTDGLFQSAIRRIGIAIIGEYLFFDFGLEFTIRTLGDFHNLKVQNGIPIGDEIELAAQGHEISFFQSGANGSLIRR